MKGNNKRIQALIEKRLNLGIKKFKQEMPVGLYTPEDILEEVIDAMIYSAGQLLELIDNQKGANNGNSKTPQKEPI